MNQELLEKLSVITEEEQSILDGNTQIDFELYNQDASFVIDSQTLLKKGKLIEIRPHTRFAHFPKHRHNYIEMIYMCKGSTTHVVNDQKIVLNQGDILFLSQQAEQEILPAGENDIAINFIILPEFFDKVFQLLEGEKSPLNEFLMSCVFKSQSDYNHLYFNVADVLPIQNLIENMVWSIINNLYNKHAINQKTMGLLILQIMNHTDKIESSNSDFKGELALNVLSYINENFQSGSLTELAELLNYDMHWLSKEIKQQTGKNFTTLLQEKRLLQASYLLKQTQIPIAEIIESVGYENSSFFFRKFKEAHGMSPKKYRMSTNA
ncbi:MAG: AraC family transcriptional regulator [Turicibacter sp.]|nr:AraC family transcriptional regulator [Turicibacter sp.]